MANLLDGLEATRGSLVDNHVAYVIKTGSELNEARHSQYLENYPTLPFVPLGFVRVPIEEDYLLAWLTMDAKIAELRLAAGEEMSEAKHKEHTKRASELKNNLLNSFRNLCVNIRELIPESTCS